MAAVYEAAYQKQATMKSGRKRALARVSLRITFPSILTQMADTGYSRNPKLLKGALISQFSAPMLVPIPNIIVFQFNPESMTRTVAAWAPPDKTKIPRKTAAPPSSRPIRGRNRTIPTKAFP